MKTILVDDDALCLYQLRSDLAELGMAKVVGSFTSPLAALEYAQSNPVDFALLDIDMPEMSGLTLAEKLRDCWPEIVIIFATAHEEFTIPAMRMKADFVIYKPYTQQDLMDAVRRARLLVRRAIPQVRLKTLERFDVFMEDRLVVFSSAKAKELLALNVLYRGGTVTAEEAIRLLWPDYSGTVANCSSFRMAVKKMTDTLREVGAEKIILRGSGRCALATDQVECDLFELLSSGGLTRKRIDSVMPEYPWAREILRREL